MKQPLICASVMEPSPRDFVEVALRAENADVIEVRADALEDPAPNKVRRLLRDVTKATGRDVILTVRPRGEGGAFRGSEEERRSLLEACLGEAHYVDLELEMPSLVDTAEKARDASTDIIVSHHNFQDTPDEDDMMALLKREHEVGADISKLAVTANSMRDVLRLLEVTLSASQKWRICTISMGKFGRLSRAAAPLFGSSLVYGYVSRPTAPGQLSIEEVKHVLEILGV